MGDVKLQQTGSETRFLISVWSRSTQASNELLEPEHLRLALVVAGGASRNRFRITRDHGDPDPQSYSYTSVCLLPVDRPTVLALLAVGFSWDVDSAREAERFRVTEEEKEEVAAEVRRRHEAYVEELGRWADERVGPMPIPPWEVG